jgi:hypothetical protein
MVDLSDHGDLMAKLLSLPCPRTFMYSEQNSSLSYLTKLADNGVELAEIPHSAYWPMYANPVAMWDRIAEFVNHAEATWQPARASSRECRYLGLGPRTPATPHNTCPAIFAARLARDL